MDDLATARLLRDQPVLIPERLDWAIPPDHAVRLLDVILGRIGWTTSQRGTGCQILRVRSPGCRSGCHEQHAALRVEHAKRTSSDEGKAKYSHRRHRGERPFAVLKRGCGARRFLTRGLNRVADEWLWPCSAFNLKQLMSLITSGSDPPSRLSPTS